MRNEDFAIRPANDFSHGFAYCYCGVFFPIGSQHAFYNLLYHFRSYTHAAFISVLDAFNLFTIS